MRSKNASVAMLGTNFAARPRSFPAPRGQDQSPLPRNVIRRTTYPAPSCSNFMIGAYWAFFMRSATKLDACGLAPNRCAKSRNSLGRGWGSKMTTALSSADHVSLKMRLAVHCCGDDLYFVVGHARSARRLLAKRHDAVDAFAYLKVLRHRTERALTDGLREEVSGLADLRSPLVQVVRDAHAVLVREYLRRAGDWLEPSHRRRSSTKRAAGSTAAAAATPSGTPGPARR